MKRVGRRPTPLQVPPAPHRLAGDSQWQPLVGTGVLVEGGQGLLGRLDHLSFIPDPAKSTDNCAGTRYQGAFGRISSTSTSARQVQLALKLVF